MKIVSYILAIIGFVHVVKHIMHCKKCCCFCGWHKTKVEEEPAGSTRGYNTKVEDEQRTGSTEAYDKKEEEKQSGSRYGSNPIRY